LLQLGLDSKQDELVRASAAFAIAELGGKAYAPKLASLAELPSPRLRSVVLIALARLEAPGTAEKISEELLSRDVTRSKAALSAALILVTGKYDSDRSYFDVTHEHIDVPRMLEQSFLLSYSADQEVDALVALEKPLTLALTAALHGSEERARGVIAALPTRNGQPGFEILTSRLDTATPAARDRAEQVAERLATSAVIPSLELLSHPESGIRAAVVAFLGTREEPLAQKGVLDALGDPDAEVRQVALERAAAWNDESSALSILARTNLEKDWSMRARTLAALGELSGLETRSQTRAQVIETLIRSARNDEVALVRQAALLALNKLDRDTARPVLDAVARTDGEVKLRAVARALLNETR
jgi:HEAT repeat protein